MKKRLRNIAQSGKYTFADVDHIGTIKQHSYTDIHIQDVLALQVDVKAIANANFTVAVDTINSHWKYSYSKAIRSTWC